MFGFLGFGFGCLCLFGDLLGLVDRGFGLLILVCFDFDLCFVCFGLGGLNLRVGCLFVNFV